MLPACWGCSWPAGSWRGCRPYLPRPKPVGSATGAFLLGLPLGLVACPACTPMLFPIATMASLSGGPASGAALLFLFGLGRGIRLKSRDGILHVWESYSGTLNHCILDVGELAAHVAVPGLRVRLVHGNLDRQAPLGGVSALAQSTDWPLEIQNGASHALPVERPAECARAIRELAAAVKERPGSRATDGR